MHRFIKSFILLILCSLAFEKTFSQEYGLVLAGGGGKGAYQVGVWKALNEYGIAQKVTVISGTSVGGLNAALFACEDLDFVDYFWRKIVPGELGGHFADIDEEGLLRIINKVEIERLSKPYSFPRVYVTATRSRFTVLKQVSKMLFDSNYSHHFSLNDEKDQDEIKRMLLATSAFPVLTNPVKLKDGYEYVDGGLSDNVPFAPLIGDENLAGMDQILVVHLTDSPESISERYTISSKTFPDQAVIEFIPSRNIDDGLLLGVAGSGGVLTFETEAVEYLIELGYNDAVRTLQSAGYGPVSSYWFE